MSGALGLAALVFAALIGVTLAWFMWSGDRREHQRKLESIQRRIEKVQAEKAGHEARSDQGPESNEKP